MKFRDITLKLGNMRAAQEFTMYPNNPTDTVITIQSDKRIARIDLTTGNGIISDGKGGHQGHAKLHPALGGKGIKVDADTLAKLQEMAKQGTGTSVIL